MLCSSHILQGPQSSDRDGQPHMSWGRAPASSFPSTLGACVGRLTASPVSRSSLQSCPVQGC